MDREMRKTKTLREQALEKLGVNTPTWILEAAETLMEEYSDQQNAELRERVKELGVQADNQFSVGYCTAVSVLMRSHDQPTIAEDVLSCNFLSLSEMVKIGVDGFDITTLEPIVKEIERKRKL